MSKFAQIVLLSSLSFLFSGATNAQVLWGKTSLGMTVQQVRNVVPEVQEAPSDAGRLGTGAVELLRLPRLELVNRSFYASFYFADKKLSQVTLSLSDPRNLSDAIGVFDSLAVALRSKYGPELNKKVKPSRYGTWVESSWLSGKTNITLLASGVGDDAVFLNVIYQVRISKDAEKL